MTPRAAIAVVAGSGIDLRPLLDTAVRAVSFADVPGLEPSVVPGHRGEFLFGTCGGVSTVLQCGRPHFYEGYGWAAVTRPVEVLCAWGVRAVFYTNAAGGLREELAPGTFLGIERVHPLPCRRWPEQPGAIIPDVLPPGCPHKGVYMWVHGPSYETRAEIRALRALGGSAVGMSTAPELHRCGQLGLRTAALSVITNNCLQPGMLTHDEVLDVSRRASDALTRLLRQLLPRFARETSA